MSFADVAVVAAAKVRTNERTRRVRKAFTNGLPNKLKRYRLTQPDNIPTRQLPRYSIQRVSSTQLD